jgi:alkaline phosphatase D
MRRRVPVVLLLVAIVATGCAIRHQADPGTVRPVVILVSFDGWRWDYDTKAPAPNLKSLMARGVRAQSLIPSFPSKTFPNLYSIVTGLYPGHHGIVDEAKWSEVYARRLENPDLRGERQVPRGGSKVAAPDFASV